MALRAGRIVRGFIGQREADEFDYTVRADGKRTAVSETIWGNGSPLSIETSWQYDDIGRLTDEVLDHYDDLLDDRRGTLQYSHEQLE